jgi:rRNA maturation RNase YbeY
MRATNPHSMIINSQQRVRVSAPELQRFLGEVQEMLRIPEGAVTVCLVPGQRIARWNRIYRGKAKPTDVLSFPVEGVSKAKGTRSQGLTVSSPTRNTGVWGTRRIAARAEFAQRARVRDQAGRSQRPHTRPDRRATAARQDPYGAPAETSKAKAEANYLGDIAICPAVAQRNARSSNRALSAELRILILHGILHLLGYDHETDTGQMERRERKLRRRLGLE